MHSPSLRRFLVIALVALMSASCGRLIEPGPTVEPTTVTGQQGGPASTAPGVTPVLGAASMTVKNDAGATLTINEASHPLKGLTIVVPPAALGTSAEVRISVGASPSPAALDLRPAAATDPRLVQQIADHAYRSAATAGSPAYHPLWSPSLLLSGNQSVIGPTISLEPRGAAFSKPVTVRVPLAALQQPDLSPETAMALLGSHQPDGSLRWELVREWQVDRQSQTVVLSISHFSVLTWIKNGLVYPFKRGLTSPDTTAKQLLQTLPQDTFDRFARATACTNMQPRANLGAFSGYKAILDYLAFEANRVNGGVEAPLQQWIAGQFDQQTKADKAQPGQGKFGTIGVDHLYQKALELTQGDVLMALVAAHNVLRDNRERPSIQNMMAPFRGDKGDERGARYHLFGMAIYAFVYEHYSKDAAWYDLRTFATPKTAAWGEESFVSNDIFEDPKEYAVDLLGADLGKRLYHEVANRQTLSSVQARWGGRPEACAGAAAPKPEEKYSVFLLTNASNGLYLGTETSLKGRTRCSFSGGGINCKPTDVVTFKPLLGPFPTKAEAEKALCQTITERKVFPLGVGLKGRWQKSDTWYGLWDGTVTAACSKP